MSWYLDANSIGCRERINNAPEDIKSHLESIVTLGFTVIKNSLSEEVIDASTAAYRAFKAKAALLNFSTIDSRYRRIVNLHAVVPELKLTFTSNQLSLRILDYLFEEEASVYTSLFFEIGSAQDLHRDTPYFWTNPGYRYFGVWVALEDADKQNGCLQVIPRSNQLIEENRAELANKYYKELSSIPSSDQRLWDEYQRRSKERADASGLVPVDVCVEKGDTIIWHPHTLHGGKPILDNLRTRLSLVMHVTPINQVVYHHQGFFNPYASLMTKQNKSNSLYQNRIFVDYSHISFEHKLDVSISSFDQIKSTL